MREIKKLDMAVEQLEDALQAYSSGRYHSAIVLAGAAEQLFAGYVRKHQMEPAWSRMRKTVTLIANGLKEHADEPPTTEDDIGNLLNRAYNHSKHAGTKDHLVLMNPRFEAQELIDRCISNFDALFRLHEYNLKDIPGIQEFMVNSINDALLQEDAAEVLSPVIGQQ